jgi:AraC-like DNA-binding protein
MLAMKIILICSGLFLLGCAVITFFKAGEQLLVKNPHKTNYALAMLLACLSYILVALGLFFIGAPAMIPRELFMAGLILFVMASYLAAPLAYLYYKALVNTPPGKNIVHILPSIAAALLFAPYLVTRSEEYSRGIWNNFFYTAHETFFYLTMSGAVISVAAYLAVILKMELTVRNSEKIKYAVRSLAIVTAGLMVAPIALLAGFLLQMVWLSAFGALVVSVNNLLFILAHVRYQDFFQFLGKEIRLARYRKSILKGVDTATLLERLNYLMNEEKYYRNFDISIKSTADELSITPHQLSMYLNKKLRIDFRNFISRYRVDEAKQLLIDKLDQNVLTIGFHVGFGSKTSFNVTFKELTGRTPSEFREDFLRKTGQMNRNNSPTSMVD